MKFFALIVLVLAAVSCVFAQRELSQKTFDAEIGGNNAVFIKFFAPWCKSGALSGRK
jgi:thiol-disulfide isomerase/thioredoxin